MPSCSGGLLAGKMHNFFPLATLLARKANPTIMAVVSLKPNTYTLLEDERLLLWLGRDDYKALSWDKVVDGFLNKCWGSHRFCS